MAKISRGKYGAKALQRKSKMRGKLAMAKKIPMGMCFAIEIRGLMGFLLRPERRFGGIGRRARLKIEY
jgi:hypothetical protein